MGISKVQQIVGQNGAAPTTTITGTLAPTGVGNYLVAFIMAAVNNCTFTPPAAQPWQLLAGPTNTNPAGGTGAIYILPNCAAGLTTVTFTITSASACIVIYELTSIPTQFNSADLIKCFANVNGATWGIGNVNLAETGEFGIMVYGYVNNTAIASASTGPGFGEDANVISAAAATNAGMRADSNPIMNTSPINLGNLAAGGTPTAGPITFLVTILPYLLEPGTTGPYPYLG